MAKEYTAEEVFDYFFDKYNKGDLENALDIASEKTRLYIQKHDMNVEDWNKFIDDNGLEESYKLR